MCALPRTLDKAAASILAQTGGAGLYDMCVKRAF
jgi:hypothetical protein